jgi:hypothetical protein
MDATAAIERDREALKRILAALIAMAGCLSPARVLPRHLYLAILRLLRPAESAARRLIIAASRGIVVKLPARRKRKPAPAPMEPLLRSLGIAVVVSPADIARAAAIKRAAAMRAARPRGLSLPLFDPPRRPSRGHRRPAPARAAPRILFPGVTGFAPVAGPVSRPAPPSPDDPIDAARLGVRHAARAPAHADQPGQARRFARWKARRDAADALDRPGRFRRVSPLRAGRPPGGRLSRFDPSAVRPRKVREIDEILAHAHSLALYALERPDTS